MRPLGVAAGLFAHGAIEPVEGDEAQGVDADMVAHLLLRHGGGEQLLPVGRVDAVEAGPGGGRRGDAEMHLARAGVEDHVLDLHRGRAAHHRVVHQHHPLAADDGAVDVELQADAHVADLLGRLDEGAADILVADDPHGEGDAGFLRVADGGRRAAVGDGADEIGLHRSLARQFDADTAAAFVDRGAVDDAVGAREIHMLEDAEARALRLERHGGAQAGVVDGDHLSGQDVAHVFGADDVERAGLGGQDPGLADAAEHQRTHAQRVAHADQRVGGQGEHGERALHPAQGVLQTLGDGAVEGAGHQVQHRLGVRGGVEQRAALDQLPLDLEGVGQVAVMGDGDAADGEVAVEGLHVADRGLALGAGGRVAHMADAGAAGKLGHGLGRGEGVPDIAEPLDHVEAAGLVMGDDAAGLLPAMLERVQAQRHEIRGVAGAVDAEQAAFFAQLVAVGRFERIGQGQATGLATGLLHRLEAPMSGGVGAQHRRLKANCHRVVM